MDLLLKGGTLVTPAGDTTLTRGDLLIRDGCIAALGPNAREQAHGTFRCLDVSGCAVLPGFVQAHVHLGHMLFRGLPRRPRSVWSSRELWRLEAYLSLEMVRAAARLGIAELLLSGTTTALSVGTQHHGQSIFEAARELGIRLVAGQPLLAHQPSADGTAEEKPRRALVEAERLRKLWHGAHGGRLRYAYVPYDAAAFDEAALVEIIGRARASGCLLHAVVSGRVTTPGRGRGRQGAEPIARLHELGLTGKDVVLAHCVSFSAREQKVLRETETSVVHCPLVGPLAEGDSHITLGEYASGLRLALGAGSPAVTGTTDMYEVLRAVLAQRVTRGSSECMSPVQMLDLATCSGARALGLDEEVGALEVGKRADVAVVDLREPHCQPLSDVATAVVRNARSSDVRHVLVDGELVVRERRLVNLEMQTIVEDAARALARLSGKLGDRTV